MSKSIKELEKEIQSLKNEARQRKEEDWANLKSRLSGVMIAWGCIFLYPIYEVINTTKSFKYALFEGFEILGLLTAMGLIIYGIYLVREYNRQEKENEATTLEEIEEYEERRKVEKRALTKTLKKK